jgi:hypothetical protein
LSAPIDPLPLIMSLAEIPNQSRRALARVRSHLPVGRVPDRAPHLPVDGFAYSFMLARRACLASSLRRGSSTDRLLLQSAGMLCRLPTNRVSDRAPRLPVDGLASPFMLAQRVSYADSWPGGYSVNRLVSRPTVLLLDPGTLRWSARPPHGQAPWPPEAWSAGPAASFTKKEALTS